MKFNKILKLTIPILAVTTFFMVCDSNRMNISDRNNKQGLCAYGTPFKMSAVAKTKFQNKNFNITDYGAKSDGTTENTTAFAEAISQCNKAGGGRVVVPAGNWLTGPIKLKSNVNLYLQDDATVIFSKDLNDYKKADTKKSSADEFENFISGENLNNIAITGNGVFNGNGDNWRPVKKVKVTDIVWNSFVDKGAVIDSTGTLLWPSKDVKDIKRPNLLKLNDCKTVLIDGPTFKNSPQFNVDVTSSENVIIQNAEVNNQNWAQNTDGIDITSCKNVMMNNDTINTGDDGICMKSNLSNKSKGNEPTLENVVIENCTVNYAHGGFVIGSNTYGGMKNIYVHNCTYAGTEAGLRFKSDIGDGGDVQEVYIDKVNMKDIVTDAIVFDTNYEGKSTANKANVKVPNFHNIYISNISCDGAKEAADIKGLTSMPVSNLYLKNINIKSINGFIAENTSNVNLDNVKVVPSQGKAFTFKNSMGYKFA
ncbi:glycoside hydrolase family 28 protein [Inconstantimicrobium mannanitabidum]|uniref:Glycoside hydrolase n=1 Tax=Inconstantimicrobium mannanitabidum TaxID=1604901 RepID=A0ACB5RAL1_9CLOT|nr:glycoside hydrolase family 28 protein [Clostridium sp. TW13]GKX65904.1 glycoside hydrolase [Clostridium sp. TW13]